MTDILAKIWRPCGETVESRVGEETVLLHLENGAYYGLDRVGTRVWELLKDGVDTLAICRTIAQEFEVDEETACNDVGLFLEELVANRIVSAA